MKTCHNALQTALVCALLTLFCFAALCHPALAQSGLVMDAPSGSSILDQAAWNGTQTWLANPTQSAPGYVTLTDTTNGQYVGNGGSTALGANIVLENQAWMSGSPASEQLWSFSYIDDNDVNILNANSGDAISVLNGLTTPGAPLGQNTPGSSPSQNFTTVSPPFPLAQPGIDLVTLTWAPVPYATSYSVGRATTPGGPYTAIASNLTAGPYTDPTVTPGTPYYYEVAAAGLPLPYATSGPVLATPGPSTTAAPAFVPVNLSPWTNVTAIEPDGWNYQGPGFDGIGDTYSFALTGSAILWNNSLFPLGQPARPDCVSDAGQRIILPAGNFTSLLVLGSYMGSSPTDNGLFTPTLTYTDGSSIVLSQGMTDWRGTATQVGESNAGTYAYVNTNSGSKQTLTNYIHGYQIPIDPTRTAQWLDLPSSGQFRLLAMSGAPLVGALSQGQYLTTGQYIASPSGNCYLTQQSDGNLVLYNGSGPGNKGADIWSSGAHGSGGIFYTIMQSDGNLVTYTGSPGSGGYPIWSSATYNGANYYLQVTDTKQVQIQSASGLIWQEPTPTIASLNPSAVAAGAATFTLTLTGTGYGGGSSVSANGTALATQYVNYTTLTATVPASLLTAVGTLSITVTNNGFTSAPATLTITATNPAPTLTSISPASVGAGSAAFTLTLTGTGYVPASVVTVGSAALATKYVNATTLTVTIPASLVAAAGTLSVTVTNPGPGGGTSAASTLTVSLVPTMLTAANLSGKAGQSVSLTATLTRPDTSQPVANETVAFTVGGYAAGSAATNSAGIATVSYTAPGGGYGPLKLTATFAGDPAYAGSSANATLTVLAPNAVDLSAFYNIIGIEPDGATYSGPGVDGYGYTYSYALTGSTVTWNGNTFSLGPPSVPDCLADAGQRIVLTAGKYAKLLLLGSYMGGGSGTFAPTLTYTDGTSVVLSQGMTNWCGSAGQPGEANAATYNYRNHSDGTRQNFNCYIYGYTIAIDPTRTVQSLTLPSTGNFRIMAMDLITPALATTTTALASSLNPSAAGQSVTFTATVTGSSPTGTVQFAIDGSPAGAPVALTSGQAAYTTSALTVGAHSVTASYSGDSANAASTSATLTQTVNLVTTTTALTSSLNPSPAGFSVTFTATITGSNPTGTVTFTDGNTTLGTGTVTSGTATYTTSALTFGSHSITAAYGGDSANAASASSALTQTVQGAPTANSQSVTTLLNQPAAVTLTGSDTNTPPLALTYAVATPPTHGTLSGTAPNLTYTPAAGYVGADSFTFTDNNGSLTSSPATVSVTVNPLPATTTALTSALNPSVSGQSVTFTATVTGSNPTGTVQFAVDGSNAGAPVTLSSAQATYATSTLTSGSHSITASYSGDSANAASTSATLTQTVLIPTTLAVSNASGATGQTIHLIGRLRRTDNAKGYLAGETVSFKVDGVTAPSTAGKIVTDSNGFAVDYYLAPGSLTPGTHTLSAAFAGDSAYAASTGNATLTIAAAATSLAVAPVSGAAGQTVNLTATLTSSAGGTGGKTLTFQVDGAAAGAAVTGTNGTATLPYTVAVALGNHTITVSFAGDSGYNASSGTGTLTVTLVPTTLTVSNASGAVGQTIHLVGRLRRTDNVTGFLPGKTLSFQVDGVAVTSSAGKIVTDSNGFGVDYYLAPGTLTPGTHNLSAAFTGDSSYAASNGTGTLTITH